MSHSHSRHNQELLRNLSPQTKHHLHHQHHLSETLNLKKKRKRKKMSEEGRRVGETYGTFQGIPSPSPSASPVIGFPQAAAPPGAMNPPPHYHAHAYQALIFLVIRLLMELL